MNEVILDDPKYTGKKSSRKALYEDSETEGEVSSGGSSIKSEEFATFSDYSASSDVSEVFY